MQTMKSLSLTVQKVWQRLKVLPHSNRQTDRTKTRCLQIPIRSIKQMLIQVYSFPTSDIKNQSQILIYLYITFAYTSIILFIHQRLTAVDKYTKLIRWFAAPSSRWSENIYHKMLPESCIPLPGLNGGKISAKRLQPPFETF